MHIRRGPLHRRRQIQNELLLRRRLPDSDHRLTTFQGKVQLGIGEGLGRILQHNFRLGNRRHQFLHDLSTGHRDRLDILPRSVTKSYAALQRTRRIINMNNHSLGPLDRLKGALDQMPPRLHQHLHRDIFRNAILINEATHKGELGIARRGKADLDFLKADIHQHIEHFQLLLDRHRNRESLVPITEVNRSPNGSGFNDTVGPYPVA